MRVFGPFYMFCEICPISPGQRFCLFGHLIQKCNVIWKFPGQLRLFNRNVSSVYLVLTWQCVLRGPGTFEYDTFHWFISLCNVFPSLQTTVLGTDVGARILDGAVGGGTHLGLFPLHLQGEPGGSFIGTQTVLVLILSAILRLNLQPVLWLDLPDCRCSRSRCDKENLDLCSSTIA